MLIVCPHCQSKNRVPEHAAGKKGKCPRCGAILDIPAIATEPPMSTPPTDAAEPAEVAAPVQPSDATIASMPPTTDDTATQADAAGTPASVAGKFTFLAPPQAPDELGRLGPYRVLSVLGQGGMGIVFIAEDPRLGRQVALKAMLPEVANKPAARERFLREARTAAAIEHDHIVAIFQVDEDRGVPYIAMPLLRGCSLEDWLRRQPSQPLAVPLILKLGREIAAGLAAAHAHGLIHRDIKPANIFLQSAQRGSSSVSRDALPSAALDVSAEQTVQPAQCRVKILDFGLARLTAGEQHLTLSGVIMGTPAYMAPEQARSGSPVDARADLFSLGVVLYRLCTGTLPFKGDDMMSTLMSLAMDQPIAPRLLNPDVPPALSDLVMRLLEKDPQQRPASAEAVVQALAAVEADPSARGPVTPPPVPDVSDPEAYEPVLIEPVRPSARRARAEEIVEERVLPRRRKGRYDDDDEWRPEDIVKPATRTPLTQGSFIVGIVSVVFGVLGACCCSAMFAPLAAVGGGAAIVLGVIGMKQGGNRSQAQWGIGLGAAALTLAALCFVLFLLGMGLNLFGQAFRGRF